MLGINKVYRQNRPDRCAYCQKLASGFLLSTAKGTRHISDVTEGLTWEYKKRERAPILQAAPFSAHVGLSISARPAGI